MKKSHTLARTRTQQQAPTPYVPLIVMGYILFAALVVATLISTTIPFGLALFNPRAMHGNIAIITIFLTFGALVPVLAGYMIGDKAVKTKSKLRHHFSGVLFGLLGFWLMIIVPPLAFIPEDAFGSNFAMRMILMNIIPSALVVIVTSIIAVAHVRGKKAAQSIVDYRPFTMLLVLSIFTLPLWSLVAEAMAGTISAYSFVLIGLVLLMGTAAFVSLRKTKLGADAKLTWSAISVSVLFMASFVSMQLVPAIANYVITMPTAEVQATESWLAFAIAVVGWLVYWVRQVKSLRVSAR